MPEEESPAKTGLTTLAKLEGKRRRSTEITHGKTIDRNYPWEDGESTGDANASL